MEPDAIRTAREYGLDLTLLTAALSRSPEQRLVNAADNAACVRAIRKESEWTDLLGMIQTLVSENVGFVLIGGLAASVHGSAYVTTDLDICYDAAPENIVRLLRVLESWHVTRRDGLSQLDEATLAGEALIRLRTDAGDLDLFRVTAGVGDHAECARTTETVAVRGIEIRVLGLDELIAAKRASPPEDSLGPLLSLEALRELREQP